MRSLKRGARVQVFWEGDGLWFAGTVAEYIPISDSHLVVYDDGDQRLEHLDDPTLKWEHLHDPMLEREHLGVTVRTSKQPAWKAKRLPKSAGHREVFFPRVILRLKQPPSKSTSRPPTSTNCPESGRGESQIWPGGSTWQPVTHDWGMRSAGAHGCGKCRWGAKGCRGCIAASVGYTPPPLPPMCHGDVVLPSHTRHAHCYAHTDGPDEADRVASLQALQSSVRVVSGSVQSDDSGFGVVASRRLRAGEVFVDWSVFYIARPAAYALAHLPRFHALEFGRSSYFQLREPVLGHCSLTYYVNEAQHCGAEGAAANASYKVVRPRGGGVALGLQILSTVEGGCELLANYNQWLG